MIRYGIFIAAFVVLLVSEASSQVPAAIERDLDGYLDNISTYGSYGGGYDEAKLKKNNDLIRQTLIKNGSRADVLKYGFPKLKDKLYVATSPDGRFRIYSWDLEAGGSLHDFDNVFQFTGKSGNVHAWADSEPNDGGGSFYTEVFQTDAASGPIYLAVSTSRGSTSLNGQSIEGFTVNGETLDTKAKVIRTQTGLTNSVGFGYDFFSVVDHPERPVKLFFYDQAQKSFRFPIVIEDAKVPQGRVTNKFITYKFDGKYFVKVP